MSKLTTDLPEDEIAKRRDDGLRRLLKMPPKPHKDVVGKSGRAKKPTRKKKPAK